MAAGIQRELCIIGVCNARRIYITQRNLKNRTNKLNLKYLNAWIDIDKQSLTWKRNWRKKQNLFQLIQSPIIGGNLYSWNHDSLDSARLGCKTSSKGFQHMSINQLQSERQNKTREHFFRPPSLHITHIFFQRLDVQQVGRRGVARHDGRGRQRYVDSREIIIPPMHIYDQWTDKHTTVSGHSSAAIDRQQVA